MAFACDTTRGHWIEVWMAFNIQRGSLIPNSLECLLEIFNDLVNPHYDNDPIWTEEHSSHTQAGGSHAW